MIPFLLFRSCIETVCMLQLLNICFVWIRLVILICITRDGRLFWLVPNGCVSKWFSPKSVFSFTHRIHDPCLVYLPTFSLNINPVHVGRYTLPVPCILGVTWDYWWLESCSFPDLNYLMHTMYQLLGSRKTFCSGNLCRHWTLLAVYRYTYNTYIHIYIYMTSIFLFSYYLLATNFPVTGHSGTAWQTTRPCQMSSPFGQVAKTVDGWRWMNTYLPWTSWTEFWLLLSFFKGWIICELQTPGVFVKSTFITLAALLDFVKTSGVWLQRPIGIQLYNLKHVFLESRISGAEGTIKSSLWFQMFFIFIPIWGRFPIWLICFKWFETTN